MIKMWIVAIGASYFWGLIKYYAVDSYRILHLNSILRPRIIEKSAITLFSNSAKLSFTKFGVGYNEKSSDSPSNDTNFDDLLIEKILDINELNEKWIDICIDESRPNDLNSFSLSKVLPYVMKEYHTLQLVNSSIDPLVSENRTEIFITEKELENIWLMNANLPMGKSIEKFNIKDSLLLLEDEEDREIMGISNEEIQVGKANVSDSFELAYSSQQDIELDDKQPELVITLQELRRLWDRRAEVSWGLPAKDFDERLALLLIEDDDDDDEEQHSIEYVTAAFQNHLPEEESAGFWNKFSGKSNQLLRETLKRLHDDLEDSTFTRPAWKKERVFLTPDIDTQEFLGDIMFSNTYLTQRIPANWEDPEKDDMSETYLSTGTMAWPGEPETDFNIKIPVWEQLSLPFGPQYSADLGLQLPPSLRAEREAEAARAAAAALLSASKEDEDDDDSSNNADEYYAIFGGKPDTDSDIEEFYKNFDKAESSSEEELGEFPPMPRLPLSKVAGSSLMETVPHAQLISGPFVTPTEWLEREEFANHVGHEVWSNSNPELFEDVDDLLWDEDIYLAQSLQHLVAVTDEYLVDHAALSDASDERRYWERIVWTKFTGENTTVEPIPGYLTPDKNRGIEYSNELIEMKGKLTLNPFQPEPKDAYVNDTFTHNEDMDVTNKIGSIRVQYDWLPRKDLVHEIEEEKLSKIAPLLLYVNHAAVLQSTKDNILIFEYRGQMRHLLGIRASMMQLAKNCFPELVDLRLETLKKSDSHDC